MRELKYEANGRIYNTLKSAPKGAKPFLTDAPSDRATYDPERITKLKAKLREKHS